MSLIITVWLIILGLFSSPVSAQRSIQIQAFCVSGRIEIVFTNWLPNETVTAWVADSQVGTYTTDGNGSGSYRYPVGATEVLMKRANGDSLVAGGADCAQPLPGEISTVSQYDVTIAVGGQTSLGATGQDAEGNEIPITVIWITESGSITPAGEITATEEGDYLMSANLIGDRGAYAYQISLQVTPPLASLAVTPTEWIMFPDQILVFEVVATDVDGNLVEANLTWDTAGAGEILTNNLFLAGEATGDYVVTGEIPGTDLRVEVQIRVSPELDRIQIFPEIDEMIVGDTQQFELAGFDPEGNEIPLPVPPTWTAELGVIDASGNYAATTAGNESLTVVVDVNAIQGNFEGHRGLAMERMPVIAEWSFSVKSAPIPDVSDEPAQSTDPNVFETDIEKDDHVQNGQDQLKDAEDVEFADLEPPDEISFEEWQKMPRWLQVLCLSLSCIIPLSVVALWNSLKKGKKNESIR